MPLSKTLAITGGTGFVGGYVIHHALDTGHKVRALVRNPDKISLEHENLEWVQGSLGTVDEKLLMDADAVIHIAGLIKAKTLNDYLAVNAEAAGHLARTASQIGIKRFVLLSSQAASQPHLSDYAMSKKKGEDAVNTAFDDDVSIIRAPAVFGPGDQATKPFFDCLKRGILPVPGGRGWKERRLSMVYAADLASFIVDEAVSNIKRSEPVTPATMMDMTWPDFAALCETALGRTVRLIPMPMSVLYPIASVTSVTSRWFGLGHLTRGKLREFLHTDWSADHEIANRTEPKTALLTAYNSYHG